MFFAELQLNPHGLPEFFCPCRAHQTLPGWRFLSYIDGLPNHFCCLHHAAGNLVRNQVEARALAMSVSSSYMLARGVSMKESAVMFRIGDSRQASIRKLFLRLQEMIEEPVEESEIE